MIKSLSESMAWHLLSSVEKNWIIVSPLKPSIEKKKKTHSSSYYRTTIMHDVFINADKWLVKCSCEASGKVLQKNDTPCCSFCNTNALSYRYGDRSKKIVLLSKEKAKEANEMFKENNTNSRGSWCAGNIFIENNCSYAPKSREQLFRTYYVRDKLDGSCGIDMVRVTANAYAKEDDIGVEFKYDCFAEINPGSSMKAYKITKARGQEEIDFFEAFHITSDNITSDENIYFEGASSMIDYIAGNEEFGRRTGFTEILKYYNSRIPENSLFLLYMYLYSEYPVIELLAKMGYYGLIFGLMNKICDNYRRESIKTSVNELSLLLNQTTKGSAALSVPTYIGQYLNSKNADISEYMTWVAFNEYANISKENFEKFIASEAFWYLNFYDKLKVLPNIIKYGYTLQQCIKYIVKQYHNTDEIVLANNKEYGCRHRISLIVDYWKDYLEHCELMNVEPDKFPQDIFKAHDDIVVAFQAVKNQLTDKKLALIASQYADYKTTSKHLDVVWPKCVQDFVNEGNQQHNCVGGYADRVMRGYCRIFFIRKQTAMGDSYITAECTKNGLGQLMYRNNQPVQDYTEREYAKAICKYIIAKGWEPKDFEKLK